MNTFDSPMTNNSQAFLAQRRPSSASCEQKRPYHKSAMAAKVKIEEKRGNPPRSNPAAATFDTYGGNQGQSTLPPPPPAPPEISAPEGVCKSDEIEYESKQKLSAEAALHDRQSGSKYWSD